MNKRLLFLFSILLAFGVSNADDLWGASSQGDLWSDSYKTKEEKKAAVRRQAHSNQSVDSQQAAKQSEPSVQQNTNNFDEWNTFTPTETATQRFDLIPVDNSAAVKDFDIIPVDNSTASEDFGLIPVDNSTANDHFGLIPVESSCKGTPSTPSSKQVQIEQAKLAQVKAELAAAQQQKAALDKANQQKAEQAAAAAKSTPQPKPQKQPSNIKVHWIPLSICAGVAITGGVLAVIFDNKASDAANRIPVNHNTYKQSYDDAGNYQTKRNIAIGIAAAGLVGMGITFLF